MKKTIFLLVVLTLSGCASIIEGMGGTTKEQTDVLRQEIAEIKQLLAETETLRGDMVVLKAAFQNIQGSLDNLPKTTIRQIAEILARSAAEPVRATPPAAPAGQ